MAEHTTWLMLDGKLNPNAISTLYAPGMAEEAMMLLTGTAYTPIAASGPLLARLSSGDSRLLTYWQENATPVHFAWQFTSSLTPHELVAYWRRRLLISTPEGRTLWLRYADSRVIARAIEHATFPASFWQAISSLQVSSRHNAWRPPSCTDQPIEKDAKHASLSPMLTVNERQLASLSPVETLS